MDNVQKYNEVLDTFGKYINKTKTLWPYSASELYRPSDRRSSAKLRPTFSGRGCRVVRPTDPHGRILGFLGEAATISSKQLLSCTHEAEWTPLQIHYFSENLVAPGIKPGASGSVIRSQKILK
jgi:hypothetical protein